MELNEINTNPTVSAQTPTGINTLDADDFLQLLVVQLTNQDPLAPTSNEAILNQLSSMREIQLSSTLADSLKTLTDNQRHATVASLIGKHVTGTTGDQEGGAQQVSGMVVSVRFGADGKVALGLDSGAELPLEHLETITDPLAASEALIGQMVRGRDPQNGTELIEGIVTAVRRSDDGQTTLELDTGEELRTRDLIAAA